MDEEIYILLAQPFKVSPALAAAATNMWQWTGLVAGGSPQELAFGANKSRQESIPTPSFEPTSANQPAYSNDHTNTNLELKAASSNYCQRAPAVCTTSSVLTP